MTAGRTCANCGGDLSTVCEGLLCPRCLLEQALAELIELEGEEAQETLEATTELVARFATKEVEGRFRNEQERARGGMGRILVARDEQLGRNIAIKELLCSGNPDKPNAADPPSHSKRTAARFLREARITGQLMHPAIVPVYELGCREDGTLYYVMKHIEGVTLAEAIRSAKTPQERLKLLPHFVDLCQAVAYAHSRGVIHRDLKPANVMVGEFGETVVIDWGLAKEIHAKDSFEATEVREDDSIPGGVSTQETADGQVLGTPDYMAPEQASGSSNLVDERTDIYALGTVLYVILTGKGPFCGTNRKEVMRRVVSGTPRPITEVVSKAPPELIAICERAMAKRPDDRYQSANDLVDDVQRFLTGGLVSTHTYRFWDHLRRFVRKNRKAVLTAAVAGILILFFAILAYARILQENKKTRAALERSEVNLGLAEKAMDQLTNKIGESELLKGPNMAAVRRELLESVIEFSERIARENPGQGLNSAVQVANSQLKLGHLYANSLESYEKALPILQAAQASFEYLLNAEPGNHTYRLGLLRSQGVAGYFYSEMGRYREAEKPLRQACSGFAALVEERPDMMRYKVLYEQSCHALGVLLVRTSRLSEAIEKLQRSKSMCEQLIINHPNESPYRRRLANTLGSIINAFNADTKDRTAEKWRLLSRKRELHEELLKEDPESSGNRFGLADALHLLGREHLKAGHTEEALALLEDSRDRLEYLVTTYPSHKKFTDYLLLVYSSMIEGYQRAEETQELISVYENLAELWAQLADVHEKEPEYHTNLLNTLTDWQRVLLQTGRQEEAVIVAEKILRACEALSNVQPDASRANWAEHNLNGIAWNLKDHNPKLAAMVAKRAVELTERKDGNLLDTLATVLAKDGQLEEALRVQREALDVLDDEKYPNYRDGFRNRLRMYEWQLEYGETPPHLNPKLATRELGMGEKGFWAPDGSRLLYSEGGVGLYVRDLGTGESRKVAESAVHFGWSPDGRRIARYQSNQLWVTNPLGEEPRLVAEKSLFRGWAPDGKSVYVYSKEQVKAFSIRVDEVQAAPLSLPARPATKNFVFSRQGDLLATSYEDRLEVKQLTTGKILLEWPTSGEVSVHMAWSPDQKRLAFGGSNANLFQTGLWVLDIETKEAVQVLDGPYTRPDWNPDGSKVLFSYQGADPPELWVIDTKAIDNLEAVPIPEYPSSAAAADTAAANQ